MNGWLTALYILLFIDAALLLLLAILGPGEDR